MIQTWIADITPLLNNQIYEKYYTDLPKWRKEKADRLHYAGDRARSVGAWILYQHMREEYGISREAVYNLSHSGRYALCSVKVENAAGSGDTAIFQNEERVTRLGCDIEMIKDFRPGIAKRFYCPAEEAFILEQEDETCRAEAFYRYWVLKESFLKATGQGLKLDLRSFEISIEHGQPVLIRQPEEYPERYYYREYQVTAGDAKAAVCSTDSNFGKLRTADIFHR
ncbi:MAG: 4'-phosphopantetheinyl transferase superfamily protein [Eubacteriales bacterium]|nr:4'-phosphopantetheinyl transferase superfamily protein [Eubacteriales bacterium]